MSEGMRNYETMGRLEMQRDLDSLRAENARLREALQGMLKLIDAEVLVRNTANDHAVGWSTQALLIMQALQQAQAALTPAGQRWTRERPTEPGWYWWKRDEFNHPPKCLFVEISEMDGGYWTPCQFALQGGEWQGPITPNEATE